MARLQKSQLAKIFFLVFFLTLFFLTPFISTSMRSSYIHFLLNLLIIVLGAEAGFLTAISKPREEKKLTSIVVSLISDSSATTTSTNVKMQQVKHIVGQKPTRVVTTVEKVVVNARLQQGLKRCKSRPSLFFIGGGEAEESDELEEEEEEEEAEVVVVKIIISVGGRWGAQQAGAVHEG